MHLTTGIDRRAVQLAPFLLFVNLMLILNWLLFAAIGIHRAGHRPDASPTRMTLGRT